MWLFDASKHVSYHAYQKEERTAASFDQAEFRMPNRIRDIATIDDKNFPYIFEKNVSIPLKSTGVIRANVYRPKDSLQTPVPVLVTYGPYGKDIYYGE